MIRPLFPLAAALALLAFSLPHYAESVPPDDPGPEISLVQPQAEALDDLQAFEMAPLYETASPEAPLPEEALPRCPDPLGASTSRQDLPEPYWTSASIWSPYLHKPSPGLLQTPRGLQGTRS